MNYVIFDLDNCLADDSRRIPLINWDETTPELRYAAYHTDVENDPVCNTKAFIMATQTFTHTPIFMTARPSSIRAETLRWLHQALGVEKPILLMRNTGDNRPSVLVKRDQLAQLDDWGIELSEVDWAYDDREDICKMYTDHGIPAIVMAIHEIDAYKKPIEPAEPAAKRAPDFLESGAETFRQRNAIYGDTYLNFGSMCAAAFPDGIHIEADDVEGFNRLGVFVQALGKIARYAANLNNGGHQDSAHDLMVYAAMLEEVTK